MAEKGVDRGPTILIVDDERVNLMILRAVLEKEGFRVLRATSGAEARQIAREVQPELILLDIMMPGEDGFETCTKLKQHVKTADIPVIFLTALTETADKIRGFSIGAVDYITKPFEKTEVMARVRIHIRLRHAYRVLIEEQKVKLLQIRDAQQAILVHPSDYPQAGFAVYFRPFHEAGGDFYDVVPISEASSAFYHDVVPSGADIWGFFVVDVSGHDLGASFVTAAVKGLIKQNATPLYTPVETVRMINDVMRTILKDGQHLTLCYACMNRNRSLLSVVGAGHPPLLYMPLDGSAVTVHAEGDILGVFDSVSFEPVERKIHKGDRFFLYTDGLIEAFGEKKKTRAEGIDALLAACAKTRHLTIPEALQLIIKEIFPDGGLPEDDLVLLGVEV
jgi:sigma-B regulation protein RsbU (phosphoserine phosphatase)